MEKKNYPAILCFVSSDREEKMLELEHTGHRDVFN